jgi:hypothetical protein
MLIHFPKNLEHLVAKNKVYTCEAANSVIANSYIQLVTIALYLH